MTTPETVDFTFKWAHMSDTTMSYTSTTSIPIWNYTKLRKIVVTNSSNSSLKFVLFDKSRGTNNPSISAVSSLNLHAELLNFSKVFAIHGDRGSLYGQPYINMQYIKILNDKFETGWWFIYDVRSFNVTYTYDYFEYDITTKGALPLQFIFKDYSFTTEDVTKYKTIGYTAEELVQAGLKYSQLLNGGYNIIDDLFPVLCKLNSDINTQFIEAINTLKTSTTNTALMSENITLKNTITTLTTTNTKLTSENNTLKNTNTTLTAELNAFTENNETLTNTALTSENNELKNANISLTTTNTALTSENNELKNANTTLNNTNTTLTAELNALKNTNTNTKLTTENNALKNTNTKLTTENNALKNTNATLTSSNNALKNTNATLTSSNNALKTTNATLTSSNNALKKNNTTLTTENTSLKTTNATLISSNNTLKKNNTTLTTANVKLTAENTALKKK